MAKPLRGLVCVAGFKTLAGRPWPAPQGPTRIRQTAWPPRQAEAGGLSISSRGKLLSGDAWGATQDAEARRQTGQHKLRLAEAAATGCLPMTPKLEAVANSLAAIRDKRRASYSLQEKKNLNKMQRPTYNLKLKRVFLASSVVSQADVTSSVIKHHARVVKDRAQARAKSTLRVH